MEISTSGQEGSFVLCRDPIWEVYRESFMQKVDDPYHLSPERVIEVPPTFAQRLRYLGPGFILSASIVGSGELIATTYLGATAGFVLFWVVIFSCLVKVAVQLEFGKHAIHTGETTMTSLNRLPGPRLGKANWTIWTWLILMIFKMLQVGGIIGAVAMLLHMMIPLTFLGQGIFPLIVWLLVLSASVSLIIYRGQYKLVERWSLIMIGLFTLFTMISLVALQWTDMAIGWSDLAHGLSFQIPDKMLLIVALGVFGITGVGGDEIMAYNYWLIEKGYAANTGPKENTKEWNQRARGWIKVMYLDALLALAAYTVVTAVFYLLGAAVLHSQALLPEKGDLITVLARIYTDSLGPWAQWVFLAGAFVVLFSTLLAALAAWTRLFTDALAQVGLIDFQNLRSRRLSIAICAWIIPLVWSACYLPFQDSTFMVIVGGVATTAILMIVVFATYIMRHRWLPKELLPGRFYDIALGLSMTAIVIVGIKALYDTAGALLSR